MTHASNFLFQSSRVHTTHSPEKTETEICFLTCTFSFCQIKEVKDKFKAMRKQAKDTFDDLQKRVEKRRQEVDKTIQTAEDSTLAPLSELKETRAVMASNAATVENLVKWAPERPIVAMVRDLTRRLDDLESQAGRLNKIKVADISWDPDLLTRLKCNIAHLGIVYNLFTLSLISCLSKYFLSLLLVVAFVSKLLPVQSL